MSGDDFASVGGALLRQLGWQLPVLLVCAIGVVLALLFWRRCPAAAALALIGVGLLLLAAFGQAAAAALIASLARSSMSGGGYRWVMYGSAMAGSVLRAAAVGCLLAAALIGRKPRGEDAD